MPSIETPQDKFVNHNSSFQHITVGQETPAPHQPIKNTLIVEDCASTRWLMCHFSKLHKLQVWSAASGEEAVELASKRHFDLVFMDLTLPGIGGLEAVQQMIQLKSSDYHTRFVICSGYNKSDMGEELNGYNYLPKPVCRQKFNGLIENLEDQNSIDTQSPINNTVLMSIFDQMDDHSKYRLYTELRKDICRHLQDMIDANTQKNLIAYERATHSLTGVSGTFGAASLYDLAKEANRMARNAKLEEAFALAKKIETTAFFALNNIQNYFQSKKPIHCANTGSPS